MRYVIAPRYLAPSDSQLRNYLYSFSLVLGFPDTSSFSTDTTLLRLKVLRKHSLGLSFF